MRKEPSPPLLPARASVYVFVHTFSGHRHVGDLQYWVEVLGAAEGYRVVAYSFEILTDPAHDILEDTFFSGLRSAA